LQENDWDSVRNDLNKLPIEQIDGSKSESVILSKLADFGVKFIDKKVSVEIWGSGNPKREFLCSEDMADACVFIMENRDFKDTYDNSSNEIVNTHINIGSGVEVSIKSLAEAIKKTVGFDGELVFNSDKPDGTMRKLTDVSKLSNLGWKHKVDLDSGINKLFNWYLSK
jgi:GDP-L-fucose synthase